jgi:broad specificity phosphatase PhoE
MPDPLPGTTEKPMCDLTFEGEARLREAAEAMAEALRDSRLFSSESSWRRNALPALALWEAVAKVQRYDGSVEGRANIAQNDGPVAPPDDRPLSPKVRAHARKLAERYAGKGGDDAHGR